MRLTMPMLYAGHGPMGSHTCEADSSNAALAMISSEQQSGNELGVDDLTIASLTSTQSGIEHHMQQPEQSSEALTINGGQHFAQGGQSLPVISPVSTLHCGEELSILQGRVIWTPAQQRPAAMVETGPFTSDRSANSAERLAGFSAPRAGIMPMQHCDLAASEHEARAAGAAARAARGISSEGAVAAASGRHAAFQRSASQELECLTPPHAQCGPTNPGQPAVQLHSQGGSNLQKPGDMTAPSSARLSPGNLPQGVRAKRPPSLQFVADAQPCPGSL